MKEAHRNLVEQVRLTLFGKMIHHNNQEMPIRLLREEYIMQIGPEL
jgi:hypothetical protein